MDIGDLKHLISQCGLEGLPDTTKVVIVDAAGFGASPAVDAGTALYAGGDRGRIYATSVQRQAAGLPDALNVDPPKGAEPVVYLYPVTVA